MPRVINISQHPLFDKKNHPTEEVNSLEELHDATEDADYGPFWFQFLSRAMDYYRRLFDRSYKTEQNLQRARNERNQSVQEKDNAIEHHSNAQELVRSAQLEVERILEENKALTKRLASQPSQPRTLDERRVIRDNRGPGIHTRSLIENGSEAELIDESFVWTNKISTSRLEKPIQLTLGNGEVVQRLTKGCLVDVGIGEHHEQIYVIWLS